MTNEFFSKKLSEYSLLSYTLVFLDGCKLAAPFTQLLIFINKLSFLWMHLLIALTIKNGTYTDVYTGNTTQQ